ncbi:MAG TPA: transcription antitermination factor NusB [Nitrospirae bacterium]|nr:transcription antitermination factor NusB [Nitrospirota bacterium]
MKRRRAREYALQLLFQLDLTRNKLDEELLKEFWENNNEEPEVMEFTHGIVRGTIEHLEEIDEIIKKAAKNWSIDRMAVVDRNILRAAVHELIYSSDIPPSVIINEAIEISRKYSTEDSSAFINGILDKIQKSRIATDVRRPKNTD